MQKTNPQILISPSIIAGDLSAMGALAKEFDKNIIDLLHIDVMDGNFVPNLTIGPGYIQALQKHTDIPLDVHLMIEKPENSLGQYLPLKPWCITIHYESTRFPARLLSLIRENHIAAGLALNPATPVESAYDLLPYCDLVLIMSVDPGFFGQSFMEPAIPRIRRLSDRIKKEGFTKLQIQVDGGIGKDNIARVAESGASIIVAGSSAFRSGDVNASVLELKKSAKA